MAKPKSKQPKADATNPGLMPDQIKLRAFAAAQALWIFEERLSSTDSRMCAIEKDALSEATKAYREVMRADHADPPSDAVKVIHYDTACAGLARHDAVLEANKLARGNRKAERERVTSALREFMTPINSAQMPLPIETDATGLGLYSDDARAVAYTALLELDRTGDLDDQQRNLMVDLSGAGMQAIAFVLDAGEALEEPDEDADTEQIREELANLAAAEQANSLPL